METIKRQTRATYGCRPKSVSVGLGCGLSCTPALSVMPSVAAAAVCGLWRCISAMPLPYFVAFVCRCFWTDGVSVFLAANETARNAGRSQHVKHKPGQCHVVTYLLTFRPSILGLKVVSQSAWMYRALLARHGWTCSTVMCIRREREKIKIK